MSKKKTKPVSGLDIAKFLGVKKEYKDQLFEEQTKKNYDNIMGKKEDDPSDRINEKDGFSKEHIKVIEIDHQPSNIVCPFCNKKVVDLPQDREADIQPCEHLLFVATDSGFEYSSEQFLTHMSVTKDDLPDGGNIDKYTSSTTIPGSIKYASYVPSPSLLGVYFGFAP